MKDTAIAENTTVNWEKKKQTIFWRLDALKKENLENFKLDFIDWRVATNDFLYKIGLNLSDLCSFCGEETENLIHLLLRCKY